MKFNGTLGTASLVMAALLASTTPQLLAQSDSGQITPPVSDAVVAHLSLIQGNVSTERGDTGEWTSGAINAPLVNGDKVATGAASRAEVQLDYADLLRLAGSAQVNLTALQKNEFQVQLASGVADYVVMPHWQANSEIDTPNVAIRPRGAGVYRVAIITDSETQVIVRSGQADISTPQGSTLLKAGQEITVEGINQPQYQITDAPARDAWDQWNQERDRTFEASISAERANPYYAGVQVLDNYGYWNEVPDYGQVWIPAEDPGWTPYSVGQWVWEPGWGWTWVDNEPWGWAPFHYGRWFLYGTRWAWWPGPVTPYYRPVWAPAYVMFFGWGGGGFGAGFGFGSIGWLPVGPCDYYRPWWGRDGFTRIPYDRGRFAMRGRGLIAPLAVVRDGGRRYSNFDNLANNARLRSAVMRVPSNEFGHGTLRTRERVSAVALRRSQLLAGTLPVAPTRQSLAVGHVVNRGMLPRHTATHFFGTPHTVVARPNFATERARVESRLGNPAAVNGPRPVSHAVGGVRAVGRPVGRTASPAPRPSAPTRPGFRSFGGGARVGPAPARPVGKPGFRGFARPSPAPAHPVGIPHSGGRVQAAPARPGNGAAPRPGWQHFNHNPAPRPAAPGNSGYRGFTPPVSRANPGAGYRAPQYRQPQYRQPQYRAPQYQQPQYRPQYSRPAPPPVFRGGGGGGYRPPLQIGHPIVAPRPSGGGMPHGTPHGGGGRVIHH